MYLNLGTKESQLHFNILTVYCNILRSTQCCRFLKFVGIHTSRSVKTRIESKVSRESTNPNAHVAHILQIKYLPYSVHIRF